MFYLVCAIYSPNTAPTNRIMAYVRALSELQIETYVVFFLPDKTHSVVEEPFPHIKFIYMWKKGYLNFPRLKRLSLRFYMQRFVHSLFSGDKVLVYGSPDLVVALSKRNDIDVYAERTELDEVSFVCHFKKTTIAEFHLVCQRLSGMIVISKGLKQYYIKNGCHPDRVHIVNMIVDSTRFTGLSKQLKEPYIAYCGAASNNKDGVDQLIKAFSIVVKKHPCYKLFIIGDTPNKKEFFENLILVKELGIDQNVIFLGQVPSSEIPQLLINAAILALDRPNNVQAKYGFPTKLGEYLLSGNPVVVTRIGDIPLFLSDGENALIADPDNPICFAEKICWAIEHPLEAEEIGKKGRLVAKSHFDSMTETKKLINIIRDK